LKLNRLTLCILITPLKNLTREVFLAKWLKKFLFVKIQGAKEDLNILVYDSELLSQNAVGISYGY
jgi:hypothetical protein